MYEFKEFVPVNIIKNHIDGFIQGPGEGMSIEANSLYLSKDGKPWIPVMGEYHFSRDDKENWETELLKMKAGGVSIVASYLFWIHHEEEEGVWNFFGNKDVKAFIETVKECGMYMVLRLGPWAHGECRNGGFPDWILKKDFKVRDNNPEYLSYVREWFTRIYNESKDFLYKDGGPVIGIQLENELVDNSEHVLELKNIAVDIGFEVPLYTATGWNSKYGAKLPIDKVLPVFGAYADAPWSGIVAELPLSPHYAFHTERNDTGIGIDLIKDKAPDGWSLPYERYPFATCEIGPGMQSTHHRRVVMTGKDAYAMSLVKLGVGNNLVGYYMYHGGTNPLGKLSTLNEDKATGYPNDYSNINYDFGTCISQYGQIREQYRMLNLLHLFINDFGDVLAPMQHVGAKEFADENDLEKLRYCMRTDGSSGFIFVNNYQRHAELKKKENVVFSAGEIKFPPITVEPGDSFIFPFNITLGKEKLVCATAQLLCHEENTYYFMKISSNDAVFLFEDKTVISGKDCFEKGNIKIKIVSLDEARFMRKLSGKVYITNETDIFEKDGNLIEIKNTEKKVVSMPCEPASVDFRGYEMSIGGQRKLSWEKLEVDESADFLVIDRSDYDVAQIYADGVLVADNFNEFIKWRIPVKLLKGKECFLVLSELKDDFYINKEDVRRVRFER